MEKNKTISKEDFQIIKEFTKNSIFIPSVKSYGDITVTTDEYKKIEKDFLISLRLVKRSLKKDLSYIDYSSLDNLSDAYIKDCYEPIRDKHNHVLIEDEDKKDLLQDAIKIAKEILNIRKVPKLIKEIDDLLIEIKLNKLSYSVSTYKEEFNRYKNDGASYDDYVKLKKELESILRKTYFKNISSFISSDLSKNLLVSKDDEIKILNRDNLEDFTFGYIYSPRDIIYVKNKDKDIFVPYNRLEINNYMIKLSDNAKPIGTYAITVGEKEFSNNYVNAQNLLKRLPEGYFLEVDLSKILTIQKLNKYKIDFIDRLLNDKGLEVSNKDEDFYNKFEIFFQRFMDLKKSNYDKGNVINLFDFYYNVIFSQKYMNLDYAIEKCSVEELKDVVENNIYYDYNIFKKKDITNNDISLFVDKFKLYKSSSALNNVYPGINLIIDYLLTIKDDKFDEFKDYINALDVRDSWLISQRFNPIHK